MSRRARRNDQDTVDNDWLITYADTITLLLCLFVIVLMVRVGEQAAAPEVPPIAATRFPMTAFDPSFAPLPATPDPPEHLERAIDNAAWDADAPGRVVVAVATSPAPAPPPATPIAMPSVPAPNPAAPPAAATSAADPRAVSALTEQLRGEGVTASAQSGDRITTLQIASATFFASGSAALSVLGKSVLREVAATLMSPMLAAFHVTIEGHTDDTPISTPRFQTNWELSTARAAAVVRFLLEQGLKPERLTAAGYADTFPVAPNRDAAGMPIPENQARNRRVVVRLEKIEGPTASVATR